MVALSLARASDAFGNAFLVVALPLFLAERGFGAGVFGFSQAAAIGVVLACLGIVNSSLQPLAGRLSDRAGRRRAFILAGLALLAVANLAYAWSTSYAQVLALRVAQGVALAMTIPCTIALISDLSTVETRGGNMGAYNALRLVGYAAGPVVAGLVVHAGPYRLPVGGGAVTLSGFDAAFLVASLAAGAGALAVAARVEDPDHLEAGARPDVSLRVTSAGEERGLDPVFALAVATLAAAISISLIASIQNEVNARLGQSSAWFGLQFSAFLVPHVLLQVPVGRASDRVGRRPFVIAGMLVAVPATLVQGYVSTPWELLGARLLQGIATVGFFSPGLAMVGDLAREGQAGSTLGLVTMAFGLGVALGPLLGGFLVGAGFEVPFVVGAGLVAAATVLVATQVEETAGVERPASG